VISHCPHAPSYGTQLRVLNIAKLLERIGKLSLVIAPYFPIDEKSLAQSRREFDVRRVIHLTRNAGRNPVERIRHEFDPNFLDTDGISASAADREVILRLVDEHDVVWVHSIRTANAFRIFRWPHTVLDIDDIQSRFCLSRAKIASGIGSRLLNYRRAVIWRRREQKLKQRFDLISVISEDDRRYLGADSRVHVIPNGFITPSEEPLREPSVPPRIGFIGTFEYLPNQEGVEWFIRSVWSRIKSEIPTVHLRLIGQGSDSFFPELGADIEGLGWMSDPGPEIASWSAMIVPVRTGAGTRIKIAEAFSRKCPVVSTSLGAFGYKVSSGEDILIADSSQEFALWCVHLIKDKELGLRLSESAWKKFLVNWTWDAIGMSVAGAVQQCMNGSDRKSDRSKPDRGLRGV